MPTAPAGWVDLGQINGPVRRNLDLAVERSALYSDRFTADRNKIRNPALDIWQRGFGAFTTNVFTADGWQVESSGCTHSVTGVAFTLGGGDIVGLNSDAALHIQNVVTGVAGAGNYNVFRLPMEDVRTLGGRTVCVSFWAKASSALPLAISFDQYFGTGGSPSATVTSAGKKFTLSTAWTRYTLTYDIPSIVGKTIGTNANSYVALLFWFAAGSTYDTRSGTLGIQSGTFSIWGVQVEQGTVATPLERRDFASETDRCMRYFQRHYDPPLRGVVTGGNGGRMGMPLPVQMRTNPVITATGTTNCYDGTATVTATAVAATYTTYQHVEVDLTLNAGLTNGRPCILYKNSAASTWDFNAELS